MPWDKMGKKINILVCAVKVGGNGRKSRRGRFHRFTREAVQIIDDDAKDLILGFLFYPRCRLKVKSLFPPTYVAM